MSESAPVPVEIRLHQGSRTLELGYADGRRFVLGCEFLRVHSPSAEVRGHGPGEEVLQTGKRMVNISAIETVGNYALQFTFSDGHDSGIYSWQYLHELCRDQEALWNAYLARLAAAGASRDPVGPVLIARQG
ncbi:MAG: gamma-butyrobetaine hydroxylase-like domain-containing protein [Gammaproteobacteria bacterium]